MNICSCLHYGMPLSRTVLLCAGVLEGVDPAICFCVVVFLTVAVTWMLVWRTKSYAGIVTAWNDYRSWRDTQQAVCRSLPLEGNQQAQGLNDSLESNIDLCENQSCESRAQKVKNRGYFVIWWLFRRFRWTQQFVVWRTSCDVSSRKAPSALLSLVLLSNHKLVAFLQFYVVYVRRWRKETHTSRNSKTFTG